MIKNEHPQNHERRNYLLFLLSSLAVVVIVPTLLTSAGSSMHQLARDRISVNDGRPLVVAADTFEQKYGWIITYEDPPFAHESDLVDVTEKVRRDLDKFKPGQAPKVFSPKGGELTLEYDIDPVTQRPVNADLVIQQLLDAYNIGKSGAFRMERSGERVHIIGTAAKNKEGVWTSHQSVLDAVITIPPQKRNGLTLLEAFCAAVSQASHTQVQIGTVPMSLFARYQTEAGAKDQKARDFFVNEFDRMTGRARLSWHLLYSATMKSYYLNIHVV